MARRRCRRVAGVRRVHRHAPNPRRRERSRLRRRRRDGGGDADAARAARRLKRGHYTGHDMSTPPSLPHLIERVEALLARIEAIVPHPLSAPDWSASTAFRYRKRGGSGVIEPVRHVAVIRLASLVAVEPQEERLVG